jgi:hypothetical protein
MKTSQHPGYGSLEASLIRARKHENWMDQRLYNEKQRVHLPDGDFGAYLLR